MISVIVPVHNGEKTLRKCVDSILHSTVADIEIILVENGSTDRTLEICQEYSNSHQNVKTIVADVTGLSHARNLGLDAAKGSWIALCMSAFYKKQEKIMMSLYLVISLLAQQMSLIGTLEKA